MTSKPALTRCAAIGPPMIPKPMKPIVVICTPLAVGQRGRAASASGGSPFWRQPSERVGALPTGLVLQAYPAVVASSREPAEVVVDVEGSGARLIAARSVCDLHVADPASARIDSGIHVVAVDSQVVDVEQQPHIVQIFS